MDSLLALQDKYQTQQGELKTLMAKLEQQKDAYAQQLAEAQKKIAEKDEYIAELTKKVNQYETDTASTAGTDTNQISVMPAKIKVSMDISPNKLSAPGKIYVVISLTNIGDEKTAGPVTLFYPDGAKISEFGSPVLAAGSRKTWQGEWRVTQKQLDAGKITFSVKYTSYDGEPDENGKPGLKTHKLNFSKIITYTKEKEKSESKSGYSQDAGNGQTTKTTSDPQVKTEGKTGEDSESKEEYVNVLDHYETVEVERSRQVIDHYETYYTYSDNGDGTFVEVAHQRPVYTTEYYTETVQQPVYVQVPINE